MTFFFGGVCVEDGRHVDEVDSHHVCILEQIFFQIEKEDDVILDCEYFFGLDIVINKDGIVDRGDVVYQRGSTDVGGDEGGCHRVNSCHVVNGVGGGFVWGDSMKNLILMLSLSYQV